MLLAIAQYLTSSRPLTIEALTTSIAQLILASPSPPSPPTAAQWNVPRATVRIAKPCALMFARYPAVQITRTRADFFGLGVGGAAPLARGMTSLAGVGGAPRAGLVGQSRNGQAASGVLLGGTHTVYVGVGTNMGERVGNISSALRELENGGLDGGETRVVDTSFLYESEAMYVTEQDKFLNAVVKVRSWW